MLQIFLIMTFHGQSNYGQQLQNYALSEKIKELGYLPCTLRWDFNYFNKNYIGQHKNIKKFVNKYIHSSDMIFSRKDLKKAVKQSIGVIVGGDQVFRNWWSTLEYQPIFRFLGDFVSGKKILASYAASFGFDEFKGSKYTNIECRKLLSRFDKLSVREKSGTKILRNTFGVEGVEVLDPVFFIPAEKYEEVISGDVCLTEHDGDYIAYMCLGKNMIDAVILERLKNENLLNINFNENGEYNTIEQWLYNIKNSKFVITNSFHCAAFAIIFKRPFIVISTENNGNDRINNMLGNLNLEQCKRDSINEIDRHDLDMNINWENVFSRLKDRLLVSENFLKNVLELKPTYKKPYINWPLDGIRARYETAYSKGIKYERRLNINFKHRLLRIIIKGMVSKDRYIKLKHDYILFFQDSKSSVIKLLGRFYN